MDINKQAFYLAYRNSLYEGFFSNQDSPPFSIDFIKELKRALDDLEPKFIKEEISIDDLVGEVKKIFEQPPNGVKMMWNPKRDACIIFWMATGAAILAAWVASGGTLTIGAGVAGVTITSTIIAALVGGASAGTIACILGSCGNC